MNIKILVIQFAGSKIGTYQYQFVTSTGNIDTEIDLQWNINLQNRLN